MPAGLRRGIHQRRGVEPLDGIENRRRPRHHAEPDRQDRGPAAVHHQPFRAGGEDAPATGRRRKLCFREASKQPGTLLVVPEQGMRLQAATLDGVTQLDPQKSGVRQKGVLVFSILETPWKLALDIEQVDPWIQVTSLQHATVNEAQMKVAANLQYQIENTGLKAFHVLIPTNAEGVTLPRRPARGFPRAGRRGDEWFAGVGNQIAPPRHRPVFAAGELSDVHRRATRARRCCAACRRRM